MVEVKVCLGSSCHIRGGAKTLKVFRALIETNDLAGRVDLLGELCFENCLQAPNVVVNGTVFGGVTPERAETFFIEQILHKAESEE